jgi:hypothetical protein
MFLLVMSPVYASLVRVLQSCKHSVVDASPQRVHSDVCMPAEHADVAPTLARLPHGTHKKSCVSWTQGHILTIMARSHNSR